MTVQPLFSHQQTHGIVAVDWQEMAQQGISMQALERAVRMINGIISSRSSTTAEPVQPSKKVLSWPVIMQEQLLTKNKCLCCRPVNG